MLEPQPVAQLVDQSLAVRAPRDGAVKNVIGGHDDAVPDPHVGLLRDVDWEVRVAGGARVGHDVDVEVLVASPPELLAHVPAVLVVGPGRVDGVVGPDVVEGDVEVRWEHPVCVEDVGADAEALR